jgi:SAM-dependent methyltransferase
VNGPTPAPDAHGEGPPSPWVQRWSPLVREGARVLDVACGRGRHLRWFASRGAQVVGVDRDAAALGTLAGVGELIVADLESGPWPLAGRDFDAIVVTNYLWRPLMPRLLASLAPGGVYLHETFAQGQGTVGRPSNPDFLLQPGELLRVCDGLHVVAYENGFLDAPARFVQRICAVKPQPPAATVPRHPL